jgi:hypothetical protein
MFEMGGFYWWVLISLYLRAFVRGCATQVLVGIPGRQKPYRTIRVLHPVARICLHETGKILRDEEGLSSWYEVMKGPSHAKLRLFLLV